MTYTIDAKKIIYADLDPSEGVLLNMDTKNYYKLNESGQLIWQSLSAGKTVDEIVNSLTQSYEVSREAALEDVTALVEQMQKEQLVQAGPAQSFDMAAARQSKKDAR